MNYQSIMNFISNLLAFLMPIIACTIFYKLGKSKGKREQEQENNNSLTTAKNGALILEKMSNILNVITRQEFFNSSEQLQNLQDNINYKMLVIINSEVEPIYRGVIENERQNSNNANQEQK